MMVMVMMIPAIVMIVIPVRVVMMMPPTVMVMVIIEVICAASLTCRNGSHSAVELRGRRRQVLLRKRTPQLGVVDRPCGGVPTGPRFSIRRNGLSIADRQAGTIRKSDGL
jgi:hypothetical protein